MPIDFAHDLFLIRAPEVVLNKSYFYRPYSPSDEVGCKYNLNILHVCKLQCLYCSLMTLFELSLGLHCNNYECKCNP